MYPHVFAVHVFSPFVLQEEGCIWKPEDGGMVLEPDSNKTGFKHYITLVCTLEGLQVAVDWSLGQFENVPADIRLVVLALNMLQGRGGHVRHSPEEFCSSYFLLK